MKQARIEDIDTLESKIFVSSQNTLFELHKLLSNKEILVVL